ATDLPTGIEHFAITDLALHGEWRFVSVVGLADVPGDLHWNLLDHGRWFGLILLQEHADGSWSGALEGTTAFSHLLAIASSQLGEPFAGAALDPRQRRSLLAESYVLPWEPGTRMQYGARGVHDNEFFAITPGWKAVDFLSDGNTALGHAPNRLLAAASGAITYKCSPPAGENSTAIRVGNLMYTHLLNSPSLTVGRSFTQGELIGPLKTGSFSEACGYASQGAAWFHVHLGFPDTGAFTADGWTLNLIDQKWRRGTAVEGIGAWLLAEGIPAPPALVAPGPGETVDNRTVQFVWQSPNAPAQNGYSLRLSQSADPDAQPWLVNTSLANGQTSYDHTFNTDGPFYWHMRTWNLAGQASPWATQAFSIDTAPDCPGDLLVQSAAPTHTSDCPLPDPPMLHSPADGVYFDEGEAIDFAWQASPHAERYMGEISGPVGAATFGWTGTLSHTHSSLAAGHTYTWRVRTRNPIRESPWSEAWHFTIRPAAPTGIAAQTKSCRQIDLLWEDQSAAEEGFLVYRDGLLIGQVGADATHYQDGEMEPGSNHTYAVTAFAGGVESAPALVSAETGACDATALVHIAATPDELGVIGGELITTSYTFSATGVHTVHLERYTVRFTLLDGVTTLADPSGPVDHEITIPVGNTALWDAEIYLPPEVVIAARTAGETSLLLIMTFTGQDDQGHLLFLEHRLALWLDNCGDLAEPNDTFGEATPITFTVSYQGVICPVGDRDLYRVSSAVGQILVAIVETAVQGSMLDAVIELYGPDGEQLLSVTGDGDGSSSLVLRFEVPENGAHFVSVRSVSPIASHPYILHVALDTEPPVATIVYPGDGAWLHAFRQLIEVEAVDVETEVERVEFYFHEAGADEPFWTWLGVDADGSDGWQWELETSALAVQDGAELMIVAYDRAGRSAVASVSGLRLERTAPVVAARIEPDTEGSWLDFWVVWDGGIDDESGLDSYDIQLRDGLDGEWIDWLVGVSETKSHFGGEEGHTYFFRARARDRAGNQSEYRDGGGDAQIEIPDLTAPSGAFVINDGALYTNHRVVTLTLSADDVGLGVSEMEIGEGDEMSGTNWVTYTPTATWELSAEDGVKTVSVRWRDRAGNLSATATQSITLDTVAPTGGLRLADPRTTDDGYVLLQITVDEEPAGIQMRLRTEDGEWSEWLPVEEILRWLLEPGATRITLQFRDLADNLSDLYELAHDAAVPFSQVFLPLVRLGEILAPDEEEPPH
ncbi:MAG: hypothetical protein DCC55_28915, partial [Chloroflexi bacterium]